MKMTSRGSAIIYGPSGATLNKQGIRIGSSDIYSVIESLAEVLDSLVVGVEQPNGGYYMPLFVVLREGVIKLDDAGISLGPVPPSQTQMEGLHKIFETNFFGAFAVTKAFLPLLQKAEAGRIVNVSSGLGSLTTVSNPARVEYRVNTLGYTASKAVLNALTVTLAKELRNTSVKVNSADPGPTATDLNNFRGL